MISRKTCFILGAGASSPYGYPTGRGLREWLRNNLYQYYSQRINGGDTPSPNDPWGNTIERFAKAYGSTSKDLFIDLFLNRRKDEFSNVGRWAITAAMFHYEGLSAFSDDIEHPEQDWISELFLRMTSDILDADPIKITANKISFITFNYDRSLEQALIRSITSDFGITPGTAAGIMKSFPIVHMYGKIAPLPWEVSDGSGIAYMDEPHLEYIHHCKENIKVMYEDRNSETAEAAQDLIREAQDVIFLGFGFAPENLKLLDLPGIITSDQRLWGTTYGMNQKDINVLEQQFKQTKTPSVRLNTTEGWDSAELIRYIL